MRRSRRDRRPRQGYHSGVRNARILRWLLWITGISIAVAAAWLLYQLSFSLQGDLQADYAIYWAVGRGILNGLRPYIDLFETKPPGIFLLSAFSLRYSGGPLLFHIAGVLALVGIPACLAVGAWRQGFQCERRVRVLVALITGLFGLIVAVYVHRQAWVQPETFGAFFGCLYVCTLVDPFLGWSRKKLTLASLWVLGGVFFKEPFATSYLAAALILIPLLRRPVLFTPVPFVLALLEEAAILLGLGLLPVYATVYLPFMFQHRIQTTSAITQQVLRSWEVLRDFGSILPTLPFLIVLLLIAPILLQLPPRSVVRGNPFQATRTFLTTLCCLGAASVLLSLSVAAGGMGGGHQVFAIPGVVALYFLTLGLFFRSRESRFGRAVVATIAVALLAIPFTIPRWEAPATLAAAEKSGGFSERIIAEKLDEVMDRCKINRYLYLGQGSSYVYGFTRHSPLGPLFFFHAFLLDDTELVNGAADNLEETQLVLAQPRHLISWREKAFYDGAMLYMRQSFSEMPWQCAGVDSTYLSPYRLFFRIPEGRS